MSAPNFQTRTGKNYRESARLDLQAVSAFFESQGFTVRAIDQQWRHIHAKLERDGTMMFLKLASTVNVGEKTENEIAWNRALSGKLRVFRVPKVFETGKYNDLVYYIAEYVDGHMVGQKDPPKDFALSQRVREIAEGAVEILRIQGLVLPEDNEWNATDAFERYQQNMRSWHEESGARGVEDVLELALTLSDVYKPALAHSDFVPWHLMESGGEPLVLIDAEHASIHRPMFYDVCYFYQRVYAHMALPDVAKAFVRHVWDVLAPSEREDFERITPSVLASRVIGGLWDAWEDKVEDRSLHYALAREVLSGTWMGR